MIAVILVVPVLVVSPFFPDTLVEIIDDLTMILIIACSIPNFFEIVFDVNILFTEEDRRFSRGHRRQIPSHAFR